MPIFGAFEANAVSSGLFFSSNEAVDKRNEPVTNASQANNIHSSDVEISLVKGNQTFMLRGDEELSNTTNFRIIVSDQPKQMKKFWLIPDPICGGELTQEEEKIVSKTRLKLFVWDIIMILSLTWVAWSVRIFHYVQFLGTMFRERIRTSRCRTSWHLSAGMLLRAIFSASLYVLFP
jgi:hypothetical protein